MNSLDLRFKEVETEVAFKASVEPEVLRFGVMGGLILELLIPLTLVPVYIQESSHEDNPYDMSTGDVRTLLLILWLLCFGFTGMFCIFGLLRIWRGWFQRWNWEAIFMVMITYYALNLTLANFWHMPLIVGNDPVQVWKHDARGAEVYILLALDGIMTTVAMYIPVRSCVLWVLMLVGVGSYTVMLAGVDSVFPDDRFKSVAALIGLAVVAGHGAYRNEMSRREKWIALQQVIEATEVVKQQENQIEESTVLVKGLRSVANALCDIILKLTEDLRVCGTESMLDAFFEQKMEGRSFMDVLADTDRARFMALISGVSTSQVHACMPLTIRKRSSLCEAHVLLVDTGRCMPRYFVGIRVEMEHLEPTNQEPSLTMKQSSSPPQAELTGILPQETQTADDSEFSFNTYFKPNHGQALAFTSVRARAMSLKKVMPRWNIARDTESCCQFHTVVESVHEVADFLAEKQCEPLWSTLNGGQCARCKSMCTQTRTKCVVCGYNHR